VKPKPPRNVVLKSRQQLEAIVSPLRIEIIERLKDDSPRSIADIARQMSRPANSITYHVRKLAAAGVLAPTGTRRTAGRDETLYALAGGRIGIGFRAGSRAGLDAAVRSSASILRLAEREVRRALLALRDGDYAAANHPPIRRLRATLTEEEAGSLQRKFDSIHRWLAKRGRRKEGSGARTHAVTIVAVPVPGKEKR